jgi:hypothetical protein
LANEYNLAGRTNLEKAQADEIVDTILDVMNASIPFIRKQIFKQKKPRI